MGFLILDLESDYFLRMFFGAEFLLLLYILCNLNLDFNTISSCKVQISPQISKALSRG